MSENYSSFSITNVEAERERDEQRVAQGRTAPGNIKTELRPTLVVGLGGTGHEVLTHLKARYLDSFGDKVFDPKILRIISFDTAEESKTVESEKNGLVDLEKGREFVWIGGVQVQSILANIDRKPFIKEWFPKDFQPRNITMGAQQVRPLGRLALFEKYDSIVKTLASAILSLSSLRSEGLSGEHFVVPASTGVNVCVVSSVCGGTGSGMFLDMAYILHNLCIRQGMPFYHINGYLVMPQAFSTVPGEGIQANAFAALRELDYFTETGKYEVNYPGDSVRLIGRKPFDICYLIDGVNERAKSLSGLNELGPLISEAIFLQTASQVGQADKSAFDNVKKLGGVDSGRPTAYSSVGTASLYFPANSLVEICANRYGRQVINEGLLANQPNFGAVQGQVNTFIAGNNLTGQALLGSIQRAQGGAMLIQLDVNSLPEVGNNEIMGQLDALVGNFRQNQLNGQYRLVLEQNRNQLKTELEAKLSQQLKLYVDDPKSYGLVFGIGFLDGLKNQLNNLTAGLDQERNNYNSAYEHEQPDVNNARNNIINAINSNPIGRGGRIKRAKSEYIEMVERSFGRYFEVLSRQQALSLLSTLLSSIGTAQTRLNSLLEHLRGAADNLNRKAMARLQEKSNSLSPLTKDITDTDDVSTFYNRYALDSRQAVSQLLDQTGGFFNWVNLSYPEVEARILDFTRSIFKPITTVRISDVINEKRSDQTPEARLDKLLQDALPFWNYEQARLTDAGTLDAIMVLGDEDSNRTIFQARAAMSIISTRDPHRVMVLHTKHGLPLFALRQYPDYKERYNSYKRRNVSPLHLFPSLPYNDDKGEKQAWQLFALGEAFEMIKPAALNAFDYIPGDKLAKPVRLGMGLGQALSNFVQNEEIQRDLEARLNKTWSVKGQEWAQTTIMKYIEPSKPLSGNVASQAETTRNELRVLAREYLNGKEL